VACDQWFSPWLTCRDAAKFRIRKLSSKLYYGCHKDFENQGSTPRIKKWLGNIAPKSGTDAAKFFVITMVEVTTL
jgi:hypothetical protein